MEYLENLMKLSGKFHILQLEERKAKFYAWELRIYCKFFTRGYAIGRLY